jgi:diguanylate cyclase (GGDEF)-like protein
LGRDAPEVVLRLADTPTLQKMIQERRPLAIPEVDSWPGWVHSPTSAWIKSFLGAPVIVAEEVIGFINLESPLAGSYRQEHADRLKAFADQAATAIQNARLYARVAELATLDELTGLSNRRSFFRQAVRELNRAVRNGRPLAALMIDLDHFKQINDRFGHTLGDWVLQKVGEVLRSELRGEDLCGRYGGEEFAVLLPETEGPKAQKVAERLRLRIAAIEIPGAEKTARVTASLGIALRPPHPVALEELLTQADHALYLAKQNGRDRVEMV